MQTAPLSIAVSVAAVALSLAAAAAHAQVTASFNAVAGQIFEAEESSVIRVPVLINPPPIAELTVRYRIGADGDTADASDYSDPGAGSITLAANVDSTEIEIMIVDDTAAEPTSESFTVSLTADAGYVLGSTNTVQVVIREGVCDRTEEVRDELLDALGAFGDAPACAAVTDADLNGIEGDLFLDDYFLDSLREGDFLGLGNLRALYLEFNDIGVLPAGVFQDLERLEELYLGDNSLSAAPQSMPPDVFSHLGNLRVLDLNNNQLGALPAGLFSGLGRLRELDLDGNSLTTLAAGVFSSLGDLRVLRLGDHFGLMLHPQTFAGLDDLRELNLEGAGITSLPSGVFSGLGNLQDLLLSFNRLAALPPRVFSGLVNLRSLILSGNDGAPFTLTPRLRRAGPRAASAPGAAEFQLVVDEGAPATITAVLSAQGGVLLPDRVTIPQGSTESRALTVTQTADTPVTGSMAVAGLPLSYFGIETAANVRFTADVRGPLVSFDFSGEGVEVAEGATVRLTVTVAPVPDAALAVHYRIGADHSAATADADASDYSDPGAGSVTVAAGETSTVIEIAIVDDTDVEPTSESFTVSLAAGADYVRGSTDTVQVAIREGVCDRTSAVQIRIVSAFLATDCTSVTAGYLSRIGALSLSDRGITVLKEGDFSGLGNLEDLYLYDNQLSTLPASVFSGLDNLETLFLRNNGLISLPEGIFAGLGALTGLGLGGNDLSALPAGVFSDLGKLGSLDLRGNALSELPADVFSALGSLRILYLLNNDLNVLPEGIFAGLGALEELDLDGNGLSELPPGVFSDLGKLRLLDLRNNALSALPAEVFSGLTNLRQLILSGNDEAPFTLTVALAPESQHPDGSDNPGAPTPGVAELKLSVIEGAPSTITAGLSAQGGELSTNRVMIPRGSTESLALVTVRQLAGTPVVVTGSVAALPTSYFGVETPAGVRFALDEIGPSVADVEIVSRPLRDGAYLVPDGETIGVALIFDEAVAVSTSTDGPALAIKIGAATRTASYASELSGGSALVFRYALQAGDRDDDGVSVEPDALALNGAQITDVSADRHPITSTDLGTHAILNAEGHRVVGREFRLSFEPSEVPVRAGRTTEVELTLGNAQALTAGEEVLVDLAPTAGVELLTPSPVAMNAQAASRVSVSLRLSESAGPVERITASAFLSDARFAGGVLRLQNFMSVSFDFTGGPVFETEEGATVRLTVVVVPPPPADLIVHYAFGDDGDAATADADAADYLDPRDPGAGGVTIAANETTAVINVGIVDDAAVEPTSESFTVSLTAAGGYTVTSRSTALLVIREGVCDRTEAVREELTFDAGAADCTGVTAADLSGIEELNLAGRDVRSLKTGDFAGLGNLTELNLHLNDIATLASGVFSPLRKLKILWLRNNDTETLEPGAFAGLGALTELNLGGNLLSVLPPGVFSDLGELRKLFLWGNRLNNLPPDAFSSLVRLEQLDLADNLLSELPTGVFSGLAALQSLDLTGNSLEELSPGVFSSLIALQSLDLTDNSLEELSPGTFSGLVDLKRLTLVENDRLTTLSAEVFSGLGRLENLDLYDNALEELPPGAFSGLDNLVSLQLWDNRLTAVASGVFSGLGKLRRLNLAGNLLRALSPRVFSDLGKLEDLDLSDNRLDELPAGVFFGLVSLRELDLLGNPGADFTLTPRWERVGERDPDRSGVFEARLVVDEGVPSTVTANLTVRGGELSINRVTIPRGSTESQSLTVTQTAGPAVVVTGALSDLPLTNFGVEVASSDPDSGLRLAYDEIGPSVAGVAIVSKPQRGDAYLASAGETISVAVGFDEVVRLAPSIGGRFLELEIGDTTRAATYRDLSPASTLVFSYRLEPGDRDDDGVSVGPDALAFETISGNEAFLITLLGYRINSEITDVSSNRNTLANSDIGAHAIINAAGHKVIGREFNLSFEPSEASVKVNSTTRVELVLGNAQALAAGEEVVVVLTPTAGVELLTPSSVTMNARASSRVSVSLRLSESAAEATERITASASLPNARFVGGVLRLRGLAVAFFGSGGGLVFETEEGSAVNLPVVLTPALSTNLIVNYRIGVDGDTATADADASDYSDSGAGSVTIAANETGATISIAIVDDTSAEPTRESFTVSLVAGAGYGLGSTNTVQVVIREGVCDRTEEIRDELLDALGASGGEIDCAAVTDAELSRIEGELFLDNYFLPSLRQGDFLGLGNLRALYLDFNNLSVLPAGVFQDLERLEELYLGDNSLGASPRSVPDGTFSRLGNLRVLDLNNNRFEALTPGLFSGLGRLRELDLEGNSLTALAAGVFSSLGDLRVLRLGDHFGLALHPQTFAGLDDLRELNLEGAGITSLPGGVFSGLGNLQELLLGFNRLTNLPAGVFSGLVSLRSLTLLDNDGAPFTLTPRLQRVAGSGLGMPGVFEAKLVVAEGAPTTITAFLSPAGGELSTNRLTIPRGGVESPALVVTQTAGRPVTGSVIFAELPASYFGIEIAADARFALDENAPLISNAAIVSEPLYDGAYLAPAGETISVAVVFDKEVAVTASTSGPALALSIGSETRAAVYDPGLSEATTLVFSYVLQAGDRDDDGISVEPDALMLAGGEITDVSTRRSSITDTYLGVHAISNASGHRVVNREFSLSFDPATARVRAGGSTGVEVVLVLEGAEALEAGESVEVDLTTTPGVELLSPSPVTMDAGASSRVAVSLRVTAALEGLNESVTARAQAAADARFIHRVRVLSVLEGAPVSSRARLRVKVFLEGALE